MESGRSIEELAQNLPAGRSRPLDLSEPPPRQRTSAPWVLIVLAAVVGLALLIVFL